jgi:hypothetical protein
MRIFLVVTMIAALTLPAYSQVGGGLGGGKGGGRSEKPAEDPEKKKRADKEFNEAIKRIPAPEKKYDPWGSVRGTGK